MGKGSRSLTAEPEYGTEKLEALRLTGREGSAPFVGGTGS